MTGKAFLSYVREDSSIIDYVSRLLTSNGVPHWRDKSDLMPGLNWRDQLREAIVAGNFYVPFFSSAWTERERSVANEELIWAIEELRMRPANKAWFIPFVLPGGQVPDRAIGGGSRLTDLQYISVDAAGWNAALRRLMITLGVETPNLEDGEPLAPGYGSQARIVSGWFEINGFNAGNQLLQNALASLNGLVFPFTGGAISRDANGRVIAEIITDAPNASLRDYNRLVGLDRLQCRSDVEALSINADEPTIFSAKKTYTVNPGTTLPAMFGMGARNLPAGLQVASTWTARGHLEGDHLLGTFDGLMELEGFRISMWGRFEAKIETEFGPQAS